jgi:HEAT repeat protein
MPASPLRLLLAAATFVVLAAFVLSVEADDASVAKKREAENGPGERAALVRAYAAALPEEKAYRRVVAALSDPHPYVRRAAAGVLGSVVDPPTKARLLKEAPGWRDPVPRAELARTFAVWVDADGRTGLLRLLGDASPAVRAAAARRLGEDGDAAAGAALERATADPDALVRATAFDALSARRSIRRATRVDPPWAKGLSDHDPRVRLSALEGSVAAASPAEGFEAAVFAVQHGLDDAVWSVRLAAAGSAKAVRDRRVLAPLVAALKDPRDRVAQAAGASLVALTGIPFDADHARWSAWLQRDGATFDPAGVGPHKEQPFDPGARTVETVRFLDLPIASPHVSFVLDASGSMKDTDGGKTTRWDRVRAEVDRVLGALGTSAEGNVVVFSDEAETLFPAATRFGATARERVKTALLGRLPAGRTALYDGIALALRDPDVDTVIVLSDGAPSAGQFFTKSDVRAEVASANRWRKARIDVVSIGAEESSKKWRGLLHDLAADSGGRCVTK